MKYARGPVSQLINLPWEDMYGTQLQAADILSSRDEMYMIKYDWLHDRWALINPSGDKIIWQDRFEEYLKKMQECGTNEWIVRRKFEDIWQGTDPMIDKMTYEQYVNQADPKHRGPGSVMLDPVKDPVTWYRQAPGEYSVTVKINGTDYEYMTRDGDTILWTKDDQGNGQRQSCFRLWYEIKYLDENK